MSMIVLLFTDWAVTRPAVGSKDTAWRHIGRHKSKQLVSPTVFKHLYSNAPQSPFIFFNSDADRCFMAGAASPFSGNAATEIDFIDLNLSRQPFTACPHGAAAQFMEPFPSRMIAAKTEQQVFEVDGIDAAFAGCEPPHGLEPQT